MHAGRYAEARCSVPEENFRALEQSLAEVRKEASEKARAHETILRELELHAEGLEVQLDGRNRVIQAMLNSASWRLTEPLRFVSRLARRVFAACKELALASYNYVPWPWHFLFRVAGSAFRNTSTYQRWDASRRTGEEMPPKGARPPETDYAIAVPLGYACEVTSRRVAVLCHVADEIFAPTLRRYLDNIPFSSDVFITTESDAKALLIGKSFEGWPGSFEICVSPDGHGDALGNLSGFPHVYDEYDYVLHLASLARQAGIEEHLRGFLLENMLGTAEIVRSALAIFERRPDIGLIASQHFEPTRHRIGWPVDFAGTNRVARQLGIALSQDKITDFPAGATFWARPAALKPLVERLPSLLGSASDENALRALVDAIPFLYAYTCEQAGFRWLKIAHPPLFENLLTALSVRSDQDLARFVAERVIGLSGAHLPEARQEATRPLRTPRRLIARLQERVLGVDRAIEPNLAVTIGIVPVNDDGLASRRTERSACRAVEKAGLTANARIVTLPEFASGPRTKAGDSGDLLSSGHNVLMTEAFESGSTLYIGLNTAGALHPDAVSALVKMMLAHEGRALIDALDFPDEHPKSYNATTMETAWASGSCFAIPIAVFKTLNGFDCSLHAYCADIDLSWRARANGFPVLSCPTARFVHFSAALKRPASAPEQSTLQAALMLARKWGNTQFEDLVKGQLDGVLRDQSTAYPRPVPCEWRPCADFQHLSALAETSS